ncbi:hypothetical protein AJ78_07953 [Emergomyces pasteurianus Ep9510]|uniref:Uncharacterized protein n=1 Tax=Emergomyces pasteurianus Ep9510 TaxID=1447872 RepID=A0A1J9P514_9EURO|nr:hypothetical protein AJ78_07953 [Emergomyces pasteurianus Ep9510]
MSDQCSLQPGPPRNPNKRKSEDDLHSQLKKAPPIGTSLPSPIHATTTQGESATEDTPDDDVLGAENITKTKLNGRSIFKSPWARDAAIAAVKSILRCWTPDSTLIPEWDIDRWCDGFSTAEITGLSVLAWEFGTDETGQEDLCSLISLLPNDDAWLEGIWNKNEHRKDWSFKALEDFESMVHRVKVRASRVEHK